MPVKIIKIIVWLLVMYILSTVFAGLIKINGVMPELMLSFAVIYAFREKSFASASYIMVICGIVSGSMLASIFPISVIVIGVASIIAFYLKNTAKFIHGVVRCEIVIALAVVLMSAAGCFVALRTIDLNSLYMEIIPRAVYTVIAAAVMYPLMGVTFFRERTEKKLLIM